ncbi:39S ribosomal protein L12, mitochondrial [Schistocerca cancellata]|uniref:39S ribosomal protein L12, mitochondrial n=1 Tax=Schistocerca cancellata TaxID=274614 RepID=UPI002119668B|nr:39S ribosomal protein L12, mitochondrial [Schistocerca cancellata]
MQSGKIFFRGTIRHWRCFSRWSVIYQASQPEVHVEGKIVPPHSEGAAKPLSPKIEELVTSISRLNLLEVAELSEALKKRLNLPDAPLMPVGAVGAFPGASQAEDDESMAAKTVKTSFTVKLLQFDEKQKVALIKEVKNLLEGMNLVQAKKFVESAPVVVKADIGKDEADKLKEALSKVGATCEIS